MTHLRASLIAASLLFAGCTTLPPDKVITPALAPVQGTWVVAASSNSAGVFSPITGSQATVTGSVITFSAADAATTQPADLARMITLPPSATAGIWDITLSPAPGQSGWTLSGIAKIDGDIWWLNLSHPADGLKPTDFLPRPNASDIIGLRKK